MVWVVLGLLIGVILYACLVNLRIPSQISQKDSDQHQSNEQLPLNTVIISPQGVHIAVRVADTDNERVLGLSYFAGLPKGQGMLFTFPQMGIYPFWMKDMNFPLDIIWMDDFGKIIDRVINADPSSYPKSFTPKAPARYVLEIPADTADRDGFIIGTTVILPNSK